MTGELLTVSEARELLGVSHYRITDYVKRGMLHTRRDLRDMRHKLIPRAEVEALAEELRQRDAARGDATRSGSSADRQH